MTHHEIIAAVITATLNRHGLSLLGLKKNNPATTACILEIRRRTINALSNEDLAGWINVNPRRISKISQIKYKKCLP